MVNPLSLYFLFFTFKLLLFLTPSLQGYQCSAVVESRYLATKAKLEELTKDIEDLFKKISDVMNKVSESEKLCSEAENNTKAITKRKEALEKELQEIQKNLEAKIAELKAFVVVDDEKIPVAYYQGQTDCIILKKPEVEYNLQVYFTKGWTVALEKMQVEATATLRQADSISIPPELIIVPNPKIQAIINDESSVREVGGSTVVMPVVGDLASFTVELSSWGLA